MRQKKLVPPLKLVRPPSNRSSPDISARAFRRQFNLADYVKVKGASFEQGLQEIELVREKTGNNSGDGRVEQLKRA